MKIAIVSYYSLLQRDSGGSVRTYHLAKSLILQGHEVTVIIPAKNQTSQLINNILVKEMRGGLPYSLLRFFSNLLGVADVASLYLYDPSFLLKAFPIISKCDMVQMDAPVPAGALITLLLAKIFRKTVIVDSHDTFQALRIEYSNALRRVLELLMEKIAYKTAQLVLTVSDTDKRILIEYGTQRSKIIVIPNGVDTTVFTPTKSAQDVENSYGSRSSLKVVFVGNMEYPPNQEAVDIIAEKLAPRISDEIDNVIFLMVGKKPLKPPSASNLIFTGVVDNLSQLLQTSDVAIAPLLHGSGTRLKVIEYLSCGLPVVSTSTGVEGLKVERGVNVMVEDDMDKFCAKVIELLQSKRLRARLGNSGRDLAVREYDWRKIGQKLSATYIKSRSRTWN